MEEKKDKMDVGYVPDDLPADAPKERASEGEEQAKKKTSGKKATARHPHVDEGLKKALAQSEEYKDKYLRTLAEMDNSRKRMRKEMDDFQRYSLSEFLLELLPVLDNLERALGAKNSERGNIVAGVEIIRKQFLDILKKCDVLEIDALGKPFDPNYHQALAKEERPGIEQPEIVEVYQKGFLFRDRLLRPVLAKVAIPVEVEDTVIEKAD